MADSPTITVVIPSYNSAETIRLCLDGLRAQTLRPEEIIVVDSSVDDTASIIRSEYPDVRLLTFLERSYPGNARNHAVALADGELIAFLDSDCVPAPDWLERLATWYRAGHPAIGGAVEIGNPQSAVAWAGHLLEFYLFFSHGKPRAVGHLASCNMLYAHEKLLSLPGFDDAYYPQEDVLFSARAAQAGIALWFEPHAVVQHFPRQSLRAFLQHQKNIGRMNFSVLRATALPGSRICRLPLLAFILAPLIALYKLTRAVIFFVRQYPRVTLTRPDILILLLLGIMLWLRGFLTSTSGAIYAPSSQALSEKSSV